jgi:hypothetical protein
MIYMGNYLPDDNTSQTKSQTWSWEREMFVKDLVIIGETEKPVSRMTFKVHEKKTSCVHL